MENKYSNKYVIQTGIGLQDVDNIKNSSYFISESERYIKGEISLADLEEIVSSYYKNNKEEEERSKEADIVATRIAKIISEDSFVFTVGQLFSIHRELFKGIYKRAGELRTYNFTKNEWILNEATVYYGDYRELKDMLQYDFDAEKHFDYSNLTIDEIIDHLSIFIANLWQIHPFEEGNTRTTAVFLIKYLRSLGFDATNDTFSINARYFRNSLVRANYNNVKEGINEDRTYLIKFLRNLLLNEKNELKNKDLHINNFENSKGNTRETRIIEMIKENPYIKTEEMSEQLGVSLRTVKSLIAALTKRGTIRRVDGKKLGHWEILN